MTDIYSRVMLALIAALLVGILIDGHSGPRDVHVLNSLDIRDPVEVKFSEPQKVMICDRHQKCADLYPAGSSQGVPGYPGSTIWGVVAVPPAQITTRP